MKSKLLFTWVLLAASLPFSLRAASESTWTVQGFGGGSYPFTMPLVIRQEGEENIRVNADYDSDSFTMPLYWSARAGWWRNNLGLELELIHDKLYLKNGPPEVQQFSLSHGYNLLTVNGAWNMKWVILRGGAGMVLPHPESVVRGKAFAEDNGILNQGYYVSGPVGQVALEKRFYLYQGLFASLEGKLTVSWVHVPINDGYADLWNTALHGLVGLGYDF